MLIEDGDIPRSIGAPMVAEDVRVHSAADYSLSALLAQKGDTTVSVCLPARDEAATIGPIVDSIVTHREVVPVEAVGPGY